MNRAVFLDRDGTLNEDEGYVYKTNHLKILDNVIKGLKLLKDFKLFIITNQSGIGRKYYTEKDFLKFNNRLISELLKNKIKIEKTYYCPHHPDKSCNCRKPKTKHIEDAKKEFNIDITKSFVIGDHPHDIEMGKKAGCKTIYLLTGHGEKHRMELKEADLIAHDMYEAAKWVLGQKNAE